MSIMINNHVYHDLVTFTIFLTIGQLHCRAVLKHFNKLANFKMLFWNMHDGDLWFCYLRTFISTLMDAHLKNDENLCTVMDGTPEVKTMDELRRMPRRELITNIAVFAGFIILCMGGGGIIGVITANSVGDKSAWWEKLFKRAIWFYFLEVQQLESYIEITSRPSDNSALFVYFRPGTLVWLNRLGTLLHH